MIGLVLRKETIKEKVVSGAPEYNKVIDEVLAKFPGHDKLAKPILEAVDSKLERQPDFSKDLKFRTSPESLLTPLELLYDL